MLAASKGHLDVVRCLTQHGADIHLESNDRTDNVLTCACLGGNAAVVSHLIGLAADVNYKDTNANTVLMRACEHADEATVDELLARHTRKQVRPPALSKRMSLFGRAVTVVCHCPRVQVLAALSNPYLWVLSNPYLSDPYHYHHTRAGAGGPGVAEQGRHDVSDESLPDGQPRRGGVPPRPAQGASFT